MLNPEQRKAVAKLIVRGSEQRLYSRLEIEMRIEALLERIERKGEIQYQGNLIEGLILAVEQSERETAARRGYVKSRFETVSLDKL